MNPSTYEQWLLKLGPLGLTFVLVIAFGYVVRLIPLRINWLIPLFAPATVSYTHLTLPTNREV